MITRRAALVGLGGAAALACGGLAVRLSMGPLPDPRDLPIATTPKELRIVRAIVEALLPADGDLPSGSDLGVVQRIDEELWSAPPEVRADLKSALGLLEWWPLLTGHGGRLSRLTPAEAASALDRAARGPRVVAQAASAYRQLCHLFFYASPGAWAGIGYDGPWVPEERLPASSVAYRALVAERRVL